MENFMEVIYKLTSPSGKYYIGRTKDYELRMKQHTSRSKT
ncbi:MAG: GIY-YIG nuclease family protein, partial [Candidatus Pelagibacter sp.]|nr:GIY-YIG nuclease family protein [Candidatus Pelagibacter sp.]